MDALTNLALNGEQIQIRKVVLQNRLALDILTAAHGETCAIIHLELSCFFDDPADVGNLISGPSAFSKTSLNIWKFTVHIC